MGTREVGLSSLTWRDLRGLIVATWTPTWSSSRATRREVIAIEAVTRFRVAAECLVSIGDLVKSRLDEIEYEARSLRSFIAGA